MAAGCLVPLDSGVVLVVVWHEELAVFVFESGAGAFVLDLDWWEDLSVFADDVFNREDACVMEDGEQVFVIAHSCPRF